MVNINKVCDAVASSRASVDAEQCKQQAPALCSDANDDINLTMCIASNADSFKAVVAGRSAFTPSNTISIKDLAGLSMADGNEFTNLDTGEVNRGKAREINTALLSLDPNACDNNSCVTDGNAEHIKVLIKAAIKKSGDDSEFAAAVKDGLKHAASILGIELPTDLVSAVPAAANKGQPQKVDVDLGEGELAGADPAPAPAEVDPPKTPGQHFVRAKISVAFPLNGFQICARDYCDTLESEFQYGAGQDATTRGVIPSIAVGIGATFHPFKSAAWALKLSGEIDLSLGKIAGLRLSDDNIEYIDDIKAENDASWLLFMGGASVVPEFIFKDMIGIELRAGLGAAVRANGKGGLNGGTPEDLRASKFNATHMYVDLGLAVNGYVPLTKKHSLVLGAGLGIKLPINDKKTSDPFSYKVFSNLFDLKLTAGWEVKF